jgi:transposase-like protein
MAGIPMAERERRRQEWLTIIEAAREYPTGVREYCTDHGIDWKAYYKWFRQLRQEHPEWQSLAGRRLGSKNRRSAKKARSKAKPRNQPRATKRQVSFAPVHLVDRWGATEKTGNEFAALEIALPNKLVLRVPSHCPFDFLSSIVSLLGDY